MGRLYKESSVSDFEKEDTSRWVCLISDSEEDWLELPLPETAHPFSRLHHRCFTRLGCEVGSIFGVPTALKSREIVFQTFSLSRSRAIKGDSFHATPRF